MGDFCIAAIEQGLIFAIMVIGVYITYKILDFPDLSVDGTFPLGGAVTAYLITKGANPYIALPVSFIVGAIAGAITGVIHVKCKVRDLLAGIIMSTALYSVNLRIAGKSNVAIFTQDTIFSKSPLRHVLHGKGLNYLVLLVSLVLVIILKLVLDWYMTTRSGYLLRATGDNATLVTSLGKDNGLVKILGLSLANGFAALSGCVYVQEEGYFDIGMGTGMVVVGLASVIIGISIFKHIPFAKATTAVIVGSIIYKLCVSLAIRYGLTANDMKLVIATLFLVILIITRDRNRRVTKHA